jgi:hypothetical protein
MKDKRASLCKLLSDFEMAVREDTLHDCGVIGTMAAMRLDADEIRREILDILSFYDEQYAESEGYVPRVPMDWVKEFRKKEEFKEIDEIYKILDQ